MRGLIIITFLVCTTACREIHFTQNDLLQPDKLVRLSEHDWLQETFIPVNDTNEVHLLYSEKGSDKPSIFYLHGNSGNLLSKRTFKKIKWLHQQGYQVIAMDYRGYGLSSNEATLENIQQDVSYIYDEIKARNIANDLIVYGYSLGTWPAIQLSQKPECPPLILEGVLADPQAVGEARIKNLGIPLRWFVSFSVDSSLSRINTKTTAKNVQCPTLMLHGKQDNTIPVQFAREIYDVIPAENKNLVTFPEGGHGLLDDNPGKLENVIRKFVEGNHWGQQ